MSARDDHAAAERYALARDTREALVRLDECAHDVARAMHVSAVALLDARRCAPGDRPILARLAKCRARLGLAEAAYLQALYEAPHAVSARDGHDSR